MIVAEINSVAVILGIREFWQSWKGVFSRVAGYLAHQFKVGNAEFSVTTLTGGLIILFLAVTLSRTLSRLIERQITKKAYLEPGLRYTLARLTQYVIIVPNSKMVKDRLINWSYGDPRARIAIPLKVDTTCDVQLVTKTLLRAAEGIDNVLEDPAPKVQFMDLADWSNDFRLLVWTNRPRRHVQIRSDINYRIERLFSEAGLKTAFPLTQVRIRDGAVQFDTGGKLMARQKAAKAEKLESSDEPAGRDVDSYHDDGDVSAADD